MVLLAEEKKHTHTVPSRRFFIYFLFFVFIYHRYFGHCLLEDLMDFC